MPLVLRTCRLRPKTVYSVDGHFAVWSSDAPHALRLKEEPPKRSALRRCWSSTPRTATSARRAQANTQYNVGLLAFGKSTAMLNPIEIRVIARHFYVLPGPEKHYPCRITLNYTAFSNLHNYFPKFQFRVLRRAGINYLLRNLMGPVHYTA